MSHSVCPWWLGYLLASPVRRLMHDPARILAPFVREGMRVLEPGPGMGFFTIDLARMVGPLGGIVVVDIQPKMLNRLKRRAARAGLVERLDIRVTEPGSMGWLICRAPSTSYWPSLSCTRCLPPTRSSKKLLRR